jgi:hypothetical protein
MRSGPYVYEKLAQMQDQDRNMSHAQGLYWLLVTSVPPPNRGKLSLYKGTRDEGGEVGKVHPSPLPHTCQMDVKGLLLIYLAKRRNLMVPPCK